MVIILIKESLLLHIFSMHSLQASLDEIAGNAELVVDIKNRVIKWVNFFWIMRVVKQISIKNLLNKDHTSYNHRL